MVRVNILTTGNKGGLMQLTNKTHKNVTISSFICCTLLFAVTINIISHSMSLPRSIQSTFKRQKCLWFVFISPAVIFSGPLLQPNGPLLTRNALFLFLYETAFCLVCLQQNQTAEDKKAPEKKHSLKTVMNRAF